MATGPEDGRRRACSPPSNHRWREWPVNRHRTGGYTSCASTYRSLSCLSATTERRGLPCLSNLSHCAPRGSVLSYAYQTSDSAPGAFATRKPFWRRPPQPALHDTIDRDRATGGEESNPGLLIRSIDCQSSAVAAEGLRVGTTRTGHGATPGRRSPTLLPINR
jgi:hypothetical protein